MEKFPKQILLQMNNNLKSKHKQNKAILQKKVKRVNKLLLKKSKKNKVKVKVKAIRVRKYNNLNYDIDLFKYMKIVYYF